MSTKQTEKLETEINIPNDVTVTLKSNTLQINGPVGRTVSYTHLTLPTILLV